MIEATPADLPAVIYTDHSGTVGMDTATSLNSTSLERQNLRLVRASQFLLQFRLKVYHRPGKTNKIADALSTLSPAFIQWSAWPIWSRPRKAKTLGTDSA